MGLSSNQIILKGGPAASFDSYQDLFWDTRTILYICHISLSFNQDHVTEGQKRSQKQMFHDKQLSYVLFL